jgi:membrane protein YdbS with pleckstrin-like domain
MLVKCPFYKSGLQWVFRLALMVLGTVGLYFFNLWVAVAYLIYYIAFFFLLMPLFHCKYCYYRVKETTKDGKKELLPKDKWVECCLKKHVACGKKWGFTFIILWLLPIVLITISFFFNFSIIALISLIGFIGVLALSLIHMRWKVCLTCAIIDECHSSF